MAPNVTKILVPTDFSETADAALTYAKTLASRLDASIHLLHVFSDPFAAAAYTPEVYAAVDPELRERTMDKARASLDERLTDDERRRFRGTREIVTGLAAKQIASYAAENGVDLIVMGTHGRRGIAHLLLGSVAEHVVRNASCPVLTVRNAPVPARTDVRAETVQVA